MKKRIQLLTWLKIISFPAFFFALFAIFVQTKNSIYILKNYNNYQKGYFVFTNSEQVHWTSKSSTLYHGTILGRYNTNISKGEIMNFFDLDSFNIAKKDSIAVWFQPRNDAMIFPRNLEEENFNVSQKIYPDFRLLIIIGITAFLIISRIYKKEKKKQKEL